MRRAVVVSYARTGLAKSGRGGFNETHGAAMAGHTIQHAVERAKLDPAEIEDVVLGCGAPEGATGMNVARLSAMWAGLPITTSGTTINRFCSSGLQAIASAAHYITHEGAKAAVGGGVESISLVQMSGKQNRHHIIESKLAGSMPALWMPMIETADIVAQRYNISREYQDEYALSSQKRTAAAQAAGVF
ncbi:MAG: acetyl-CoA C-acyltransferase, partial [Hyphomonadaceae bacterium]